MAEQTKISWADRTVNPWIGCSKISPACDNCYAERQDQHRKWTPAGWGPGKPRRQTKTLDDAAKWNSQMFYECCACGARGTGRELEAHAAVGGGCRHTQVSFARCRVFCASLSDWLDNEVPIEWFVKLLERIRLSPGLDWMLLSKRIGNWRSRMEAAEAFVRARTPTQFVLGHDELLEWIRAWLRGEAPRHVLLGSTFANQGELQRDFSKLVRTPAHRRFASMEPLLGPIDVGPTIRKLDWIIVGGESGANARPMHPAWVRSLRDQCAAAGVPFHFKQWGEWGRNGDVRNEIGTDDPIYARAVKRIAATGSSPFVHNLGDGLDAMIRAGVKDTGRKLDGVEYNGFPA